MMIDQKSADELLATIRPNAADYGPLAFRGLIGMVPVVGSALAACVEAIPGQRLDRVADCVRHVELRLSQSEKKLEQLKTLFENGAAPERAQLVRVGLTSAADVLSAERLKRIADIIAGGLLEGEEKAQELTRVLRSIQNLDDVELSVLGEAVRFGNLGLVIKGSPLPQRDTLLISTSGDEPPRLPPALEIWATPQLYLVLMRLANAGLLDAGSAIVIDERTHKFFQASPMGRLLYEEFTGNTAPPNEDQPSVPIDGGTF